MKTKVVLSPPGVFPREDLYARKHWRRVQYLADQFWRRWRREYLQNLQQRQKWNEDKRNVQVGDVVMVSEANLPRCKWRLARIADTYPEEDDRVRNVQLNLGGNQFLDRPVQKLIILVPKEEQIA
jgi:hypothetical protein